MFLIRLWWVKIPSENFTYVSSIPTLVTDWLTYWLYWLKGVMESEIFVIWRLAKPKPTKLIKPFFAQFRQVLVQLEKQVGWWNCLGSLSPILDWLEWIQISFFLPMLPGWAPEAHRSLHAFKELARHPNTSPQWIETWKKWLVSWEPLNFSCLTTRRPHITTTTIFHLSKNMLCFVRTRFEKKMAPLMATRATKKVQSW